MNFIREYDIKFMKNYLLTDFNTEIWKGINMESVKTQVELLNEKINRSGIVYGELGNPETLDISFAGVSHFIKNLTFTDGKVYGDVGFLDNPNGLLADNAINSMGLRFGIRSAGTTEQYKGGEIVIENIFTWDVINN
jgi:hypothetical protein